jgi:hypothetical protein
MFELFFAVVLHDGAALAGASHVERGPAQPCGLQPPPDVFEHDPPVDCTMFDDTGYTEGNPFQISLVTIDGEPVELQTANAYWLMREAAAADGIDMHIVSGFRTMEEQEYFYMCYQCCCCNSCNVAAQPGYSNHQSGHALDLNASAAGVYDWLAAHGGEYGFEETVPSENWHWEWWGGGPGGGGVCEIATPPTGSLEPPACETITGWAQDPDVPDASIDVHLYFGAPSGDPNAVSTSVLANVERPDVCGGGPCPHGFVVPVPVSLMDGAQHPVHAYGIDVEGTAENAQLGASPQQIQCAPPEVAGVRRLVADTETLAAWKLSEFWHGVAIDPAAVAALAEWQPIEPTPRLVQVAGAPEVWLVDLQWRRHVPSPEVAVAWGLDLAAVEIVDDATLAGWDEGTPVRARPLLVADGGGAIFLVDDSQEDGAATGGSTADGGGEAGSGDDAGSASDSSAGSGVDEALPDGYGEGGSGCGCRTDGRGRALGFASLLVVVARRRARGHGYGHRAGRSKDASRFSAAG